VTPSQIASAERIERELAARPVGSTLRTEEPQVAPTPSPVPVDPNDWPAMVLGAIPREGTYPCRKHCGATVARPGVCSTCGTALDVLAARAEFAAALDSIPESFRWATPGAGALGTAVKPVITPKGTVALLGTVIEHMLRALITGTVHTFTIIGPEPDCGKTALACAVMRGIIDAAVESWLTYRRTHGTDRLAQRLPEPRIMTLARGARFIAARDLMQPRDRGPDAPPPAFAAARGATLLVLDELGQELDLRDGGAHANSLSSTRAGVSTEVIAHRWDPGLPTIITTPLLPAAIERLYGGGIEKRTSKGREARIIRIGA
jgi:hypothetical protein